MFVQYSACCLPKAGRSEGEYEDAFRPDHVRSRLNPQRFAVADGATESSFANLWARQLAAAYCNPRCPSPTEAEAFRAYVEWRGRRWVRHIFRKPLPWNVQAKAEQGALATLVGLCLYSGEQEQGGRWEAVALGDSCLFQVRAGELITSFFEQESKSFGYFPMLVSSIPGRNESVWAALGDRIAVGEWQAGDVFLLMTDALAHWFLSDCEAGGMPWQTLTEVMATQEQFATWVEDERHAQRMHNDDVTVLRLEVGEPA